jgi:transposase-like protein
MQEMLEAEMTDALGAERGERSAARLGYCSGVMVDAPGAGS